jgi:hypothetical protein
MPSIFGSTGASEVLAKTSRSLATGRADDPMAEEEREEWAKASAEDATAAKKATIDEEIFIVLFVLVVRFGFGVGENKK